MYKSAAAVFLTLAIAPSLAIVGCNRADSPGAGESPAPASSMAPVNDSWITTKIQSQYFADGTVKGRHIDVTTTNGVVMLMGRVDSEEARQRAVDIAQRTDGVTKVEEHLNVASEPSRTASNQALVADRIASGWITTKIQAQYFADPAVKGHDIDVDTVNGVVTLNGRVDTDAAHQRAVAIARQTDGVRDVEDHLSVAPERAADGGGRADTPRSSVGGALNDAEITARIQSKYFVDDEVKAREVNVDTKDGVVTLSGTVDSERAHRQAVRLARRTPGVNDVRDQLRVEAPAATSGGRGTESTAKNVTGTIEDAWITAKIQSKYFLDGDVKGRNIDVTTDHGVVTLSGEVDSPEAHQQALAVARETDGVTRVIDKLKTKRS